MTLRAGAMILVSIAIVAPRDAVAAEETGSLAAERSAAIQKNFVASKHALKEYCKGQKSAQAAVFDAAWDKYLSGESAEMKAYSATPEFASAAADVLKEFIAEAKKGGMALDGLTKSCEQALELKSF